MPDNPKKSFSYGTGKYKTLSHTTAKIAESHRRRRFSWDFYSKLIIVSYFLLQALRWRILPQFIDVYYHLLTGWGFIQAGGYSGWDFWQYAPFGRVHIYPPVFHIILASILKTGINKIFLAKLIEVIAPVLFLSALWIFVRKNYTKRLAFFVILTAGSSFSFYLSLYNNIPATLAIILGFFALDQLFQYKFLRSALILALSFYTHIGVAWFFAFSIILYGLFNQQYRNMGIFIFVCALTLALPILFKQLAALGSISLSGISEKYFCEFKPVEYMLAFLGLVAALKMERKYWLFLSLFLASFVFFIYPYRFFSAQGYLPIIFLLGVSLDILWQKFQNRKGPLKYLPFLMSGYFLFFSPTLLMEKPTDTSRIGYRIYFADSTFSDMMFPEKNKRIASNSLWFPYEYLPAAEIIKQNSQSSDIVYSRLHILGVFLASISERPSANGLFPEIGASREFDPFPTSKIIILPKDDSPQIISSLVERYNLLKIGENNMFFIYKNPSCHTKAAIKRASISFKGILFIALVYMFIFWQIGHPFARQSAKSLS